MPALSEADTGSPGTAEVTPQRAAKRGPASTKSVSRCGGERQCLARASVDTLQGSTAWHATGRRVRACRCKPRSCAGSACGAECGGGERSAGRDSAAQARGPAAAGSRCAESSPLQARAAAMQLGRKRTSGGAYRRARAESAAHTRTASEAVDFEPRGRLERRSADPLSHGVASVVAQRLSSRAARQQECPSAAHRAACAGGDAPAASRCCSDSPPRCCSLLQALRSGNAPRVQRLCQRPRSRDAHVSFVPLRASSHRRDTLGLRKASNCGVWVSPSPASRARCC